MTLSLPGGAAIALPPPKEPVSAGRAVTLGVRPEHVRIDGQGDGRVRGVLRPAEHLGSETIFYISLAEGLEVAVKADRLARGKVTESCAASRRKPATCSKTRARRSSTPASRPDARRLLLP